MSTLFHPISGAGGVHQGQNQMLMPMFCDEDMIHQRQQALHLPLLYSGRVDYNSRPSDICRAKPTNDRTKAQMVRHRGRSINRCSARRCVS